MGSRVVAAVEPVVVAAGGVTQDGVVGGGRPPDAQHPAGRVVAAAGTDRRGARRAPRRRRRCGRDGFQERAMALRAKHLPTASHFGQLGLQALDRRALPPVLQEVAACVVGRRPSRKERDGVAAIRRRQPCRRAVDEVGVGQDRLACRTQRLVAGGAVQGGPQPDDAGGDALPLALEPEAGGVCVAHALFDPFPCPVVRVEARVVVAVAVQVTQLIPVRIGATRGRRPPECEPRARVETAAGHLAALRSTEERVQDDAPFIGDQAVRRAAPQAEPDDAAPRARPAADAYDPLRGKLQCRIDTAVAQMGAQEAHEARCRHAVSRKGCRSAMQPAGAGGEAAQQGDPGGTDAPLPVARPVQRKEQRRRVGLCDVPDDGTGQPQFGEHLIDLAPVHRRRLHRRPGRQPLPVLCHGDRAMNSVLRAAPLPRRWLVAAAGWRPQNL